MEKTVLREIFIKLTEILVIATTQCIIRTEKLKKGQKVTHKGKNVEIVSNSRSNSQKLSRSSSIEWTIYKCMEDQL